MFFTVSNYPSDERFAIEKFLNFETDCYDVINSPFLNILQTLPVNGYYDVNNGYKNIDQISQAVYGDPFYSFYILYYNNLISEIIPENTTLKLFAVSDLDDLYFNLSNGIIPITM